MAGRLVIGAALFLAAPASVQAQSAVPVAATDPGAGFSAFLNDIRARAIGEGVRPETADAILPGLSFNPRVVALDRNQPDDSRPSTIPKLSDYLARRLVPARINPGRARYQALLPRLMEVERLTGVPGRILVGIWGMETSYGAVTGNFDLFRSLASLAYDGRRRELFSGELVAALKIVDRGMASREQLVGSWAGATGHPQFLPSSYLDRAIDGDGDGRIDIWGSELDALASIGSYLAKAGWTPGLPWGVEVVVPATLDRQQIQNSEVSPTCPRVHARHSKWLSVAQWKALGVRAAAGALPQNDAMATLIEADGPGTRAFLTFGNYRALLDYNCSNFYAISVGLLADAVAR